jgi:hypothetical protein
MGATFDNVTRHDRHLRHRHRHHQRQRYLLQHKVSGTPSGGLSNPTTTFTIARDPGNSGF